MSTRFRPVGALAPIKTNKPISIMHNEAIYGPAGKPGVFVKSKAVCDSNGTPLHFSTGVDLHIDRAEKTATFTIYDCDPCEVSRFRRQLERAGFVNPRIGHITGEDDDIKEYSATFRIGFSHVPTGCTNLYIYPCAEMLAKDGIRAYAIYDRKNPFGRGADTTIVSRNAGGDILFDGYTLDEHGIDALELQMDFDGYWWAYILSDHAHDEGDVWRTPVIVADDVHPDPAHGSMWTACEFCGRSTQHDTRLAEIWARLRGVSI